MHGLGAQASHPKGWIVQSKYHYVITGLWNAKGRYGRICRKPQIITYGVGKMVLGVGAHCVCWPI